MNKQRVLRGLLQHNYFPSQRADRSELPPEFSTASFTPGAATELATLTRNGENTKRKLGYDAVEYRQTRFNGAVRHSQIPHPAAYSDLCLLITDNWKSFRHLEKSDSSRIRPQNHEDGRLFVMDYEDHLEATSRTLELKFGKRFSARSDIASCYPSIYSHAVQWALLGHTEAKAASRKPVNKRTNKEGFAADLDRAIRQMVRNESNGVPIGPGTSNIIVELILQCVDARLGTKTSRYIDDVVAHFDTEEDAQKFLRRFADTLHDYKLYINHAKTSVRPVSASIDDPWIAEARLLAPPKKSGNVRQLINYVDRAASNVDTHPNSSVLKYAVKSAIAAIDHTDPNVRLFQDFILNLAFHHQHLVPLLHLLPDAGPDYVNDRSPQFVEIGVSAAKAKRSDATSWIIHHLQQAQLQIDDRLVQAVCEGQDCVPMTMLIRNPESRGAIHDFAVDLDEDYAHDQYWLLRYELYRERTLKPASLSPHEKKVFMTMQRHGISFLDRL